MIIIYAVFTYYFDVVDEIVVAGKRSATLWTLISNLVMDLNICVLKLYTKEKEYFSSKYHISQFYNLNKKIFTIQQFSLQYHFDLHFDL